MKLDKKLYTANVTVTGGRGNGTAKSDDGQLDIQIGSPKELGGDGDSGTNPEQLFAAGYAACFVGAMGVVAQQKEISLPTDMHINSEVSLGKNGEKYSISAAMHVHLPTMEQAAAEALVEAAHHVCPYSNATRGNIEVDFTVTV